MTEPAIPAHSEDGSDDAADRQDGLCAAERTPQATRSLRVWPASPHPGTGRSHGTSTSESFDRWFRYPAGFASDYANYLLSRLGLGDGQTVVDCFAGSGVTGTAARRA